MNTTGYKEDIRKRMTEDGGCPLCELVRDREFETLAHLQYVVTGDEGIRGAIASEGGFCDFHFRQFRKIANSETNALLLIALVDEYCRRHGTLTVKCRVCAELESCESELLEEMCNLLIEESFRGPYIQSSGLCIQHLHSVQDCPITPDMKLWLNETQIQQLRRNIPALTAMSTRSYFDTTYSQRRAISRVAEKFAGRKALGL